MSHLHLINAFEKNIHDKYNIINQLIPLIKSSILNKRFENICMAVHM